MSKIQKINKSLMYENKYLASDIDMSWEYLNNCELTHVDIEKNFFL